MTQSSQLSRRALLQGAGAAMAATAVSPALANPDDQATPGLAPNYESSIVGGERTYLPLIVR